MSEDVWSEKYSDSTEIKRNRLLQQ